MIAPDEIGRTVDIDWAYVIEPSEDFRRVWDYQAREGMRLIDGMSYSSDRVERMSVEELEGLI